MARIHESQYTDKKTETCMNHETELFCSLNDLYLDVSHNTIYPIMFPVAMIYFAKLLNVVQYLY